MALGSNYDNNKKQNSPNVYSEYGMANSESLVDASQLSATFWNKMLKLSIAPKKPNQNSEYTEYDHENEISIYLNHTKARMLHDEIKGFLADPVGFNSSGVLSNNKLITISNGAEFGKPGVFIIIRQVNLDNLNIESSFAYEVKSEFFYSVRNFDEKTKDFKKITEDYNSIEVLQILDLLEQYYTAMTNAGAYAILEQMKYNNSRINTKLDSICDKLGVQMQKGGSGNGGSYKRGTSAFDKAAPTSYSSASMEDLESYMED